MNDLDKIKKNRFEFLHHLWKKSGGNQHDIFDGYNIGQELGFQNSEVDLISQYLEGEGLIKDYQIMREVQVSITHYGVKEVESALSNPEQPTHYFPPVNIINIHHMEGGQIQQGTNASQQSGNFEISSYLDISEFIEKLKNEVSNIPLSQEDKVELETDISTVEIQSNSSRPKTGIIKESLQSIKRILEGASGSIVAQQLLQAIPTILDKL